MVIIQQHRWEVQTMLVVSEKLLEPTLSPKVCLHQRWLLSKLEMEWRECCNNRCNWERQRGKSCPSSVYPHKILTELRLSELEMMARAKAGEMGPSFNVESSDGMFCVPTVDSFGVPQDIDAVRTKNYSSQAAKSLLKDFFWRLSSHSFGCNTSDNKF